MRILAAIWAAAVALGPDTATAQETSAPSEAETPLSPTLSRIIAAGPAFIYDEDEAAGSGYARRNVFYNSDGTFAFVFENDAIAGTDRNYTNGFRASYMGAPRLRRFRPYDVANTVSDAGVGPVTLDNAIDIIPTRDKIETPRERVYVRRGFHFGQSIFTPRDIERAVPDREDRPYAGWLYGGVTYVVERRRNERVVLDTFQANLGMVGPSAFGDEVQNQFHRWIGDDPANGWDFQLDNEPGLELLYERRIQLWTSPRLGPVQASFEPHVGGALGNVTINGRFGGTVRIGDRLDLDYGPARVRPALAGANFFLPDPDGFNWYVFLGADVRGVGRNLFLDGNTFDNDSPSVDKRTFVFDAQTGLAVQTGRLQTALTLVYRSKEFMDQLSPDRFGAITVEVAL
ncbi:MAG: lipid A deacylase LpxR family protein [Pseudomonadota bacterium]